MLRDDEAREERKTMKLIKTQDAVGKILCHDLTQIIRGVTKDARFRKGHVIKEEDIDVLLSMGKENLYIWEAQEGMLHENEAAMILFDICQGEHMTGSEIKEGKIELIAQCDGLLKINVEKLQQINALGKIAIATRHSNFPVKAGDKLAGMRVIPLIIEKEIMEEAKAVAGVEPLFTIMPYQKKKVSIITTGSEVYHQRIEDTFSPVIVDKLAEFPVEILSVQTCDDQPAMITAAIAKQIEQGADMIICTGGMSVDPDDRTPLAIRNVGGEIVTYGAAVLPGAMFMLSFLGDIPIMGLPGCVMYAKRTIFDLVLPRIIAGEQLTKQDFTVLGHGGLCLNCENCYFPNCGFGKA